MDECAANFPEHVNDKIIILPKICAFCGRPGKLSYCSGCHKTGYCNREHQLEHWKMHKRLCKKLSSHASVTSDSVSKGDEEDKAYDELIKHSIKPIKVEKDMLKSAGVSQNLVNYVVKCLNDYGICVVDELMGDPHCSSILNEVKSLQAKGSFSDGQLVSNINHPQRVRGDEIAWVERGDELIPCASKLLFRLDSLIMACNGLLGNINIQGRTKAMIACYPGQGSQYVKHVDNPNEDGRVITCIYYLNKDWDIAVDGGLLRIYPQRFAHVADIEPKFDRVALFWSDRRNPHEVQPAHKDRFAITVWYFDAQQRQIAVSTKKDIL